MTLDAEVVLASRQMSLGGESALKAFDGPAKCLIGVLLLLAVLGSGACKQQISGGFEEPEKAAEAYSVGVLTGDTRLMQQATGREWDMEELDDERKILFGLDDETAVLESLARNSGDTMPGSKNWLVMLSRVKTDPASPRATYDGIVNNWMAVGEIDGKWFVKKVYLPAE